MLKNKINITNVSGLQFFQLLRFGTLFLISVVFAKSSFTTWDIGSYEIVLLIAGGLTYFWVSGLIQSLLPLYKNNKTFKNDGPRNPVIFNAWLLIVVLSVISAGIFFIFKSQLAEMLTSQRELPYINLIILYIVASSPANLVEYIYLLHNKSKHIVIYGIVSFGLQLFMVTAPALMGFGVKWALIGLIFIAVLRNVWIVILIFKFSRFKISYPFIKEHISIAVPLVLSIFLSGTAQYIDGFLVTWKFNESYLAIFRYGARELPFVVLLANAMSTAMLTEFAKPENIQNGLQNLYNRSRKLMHILFPLSAGLLLISNLVYPLLFSPSFDESAKVFNVYILIIMSRLVFPQTILIGMKKTGIILFASATELIINVALSIFLIYHFGIIGVAFATLIAYMIEKIIHMIYLKKKLNIPTSTYIPLKQHILYSLGLLLIYCITDYVLF